MITILAPAYNEEAVIERFVTELERRLTLNEDHELLIVNDGSRDSTKQILEDLQTQYPMLRVVHHPHNKGLGAALETGFRAAKGRAIVTMDADLTHPPEIIQSMIDQLEHADVCVASRYVKGGGMQDVPWWRVWLSVIANGIFQVCYGTRLRDITAGFKAYRREAIQAVSITSSGFDVQLDITIKLIRNKVRFAEIPYVLKNREQGESKMRYMKLIPRYAKTMMRLILLRWFGIGAIPPRVLETRIPAATKIEEIAK